VNRWFAAVTLPAPSTPSVDRRGEVDAVPSRDNALSAAANSPEVLDRTVAPVSEETQWYELVGRLFEYKQQRRRSLGERGHADAEVIDIP
jgi:hypothetical protein